MSTLKDDLFHVECLKEVAWPYGAPQAPETFLQDNAARLFRVVRDTRDLPFLCAHEFLAEQLATIFSLNVPKGRTLRFENAEIYAQDFDGAWQPCQVAWRDASPELKTLAANLLVFDWWLGNAGRPQGGLLLESANSGGSSVGVSPSDLGVPKVTATRTVRNTKRLKTGEGNGASSNGQQDDLLTNGNGAVNSGPSGDDEPTADQIIATRHQYCFIGLTSEDDENDGQLPLAPDAAALLADHPALPLITGQMDVDAPLQQLEAMQGDWLRDQLRRVPSRWLTPSQKSLAFDYLSHRAQHLRQHANQLKDLCPNWG
jgi:hypothetical protein